MGGVCKVIFMSNPTTVLRLRRWLCCVVVGVVIIKTVCSKIFLPPGNKTPNHLCQASTHTVINKYYKQLGFYDLERWNKSVLIPC